MAAFRITVEEPGIGARADRLSKGRERKIRLAALWAVDYGDEGVQLFAIRASAEDFDDVGAGF